MYRNEQYPNEEVKFVAGKFFSNHNTNFDLIFILNITSLHSDRYCDVRHKLVHIKNSWYGSDSRAVYIFDSATYSGDNVLLGSYHSRQKRR